MVRPNSLLHHHNFTLAGYGIGNPVSIPQLSPLDSYRTLGAYLSPSGDTSVAFDVPHQKSLDYATKLPASTLDKESAFWSYILYYIPKAAFPLHALTLSEHQYHLIQFPSLMALLPKLHFNRHTAQRIVHGPLLYSRIELPNLYTCQGTNQLKYLMRHLQAQDKTYKLILISHGYIQLLMGISANFLYSDFSKYGQLAETSWLKSIWCFMSKLQLTINMVKAWVPPPLAGNNINLMDFFMSQGLSVYHLQYLSRCRVYL
jgi:hypothetical protein